MYCYRPQEKTKRVCDALLDPVVINEVIKKVDRRQTISGLASTITLAGRSNASRQNKLERGHKLPEKVEKHPFSTKFEQVYKALF